MSHYYDSFQASNTSANSSILVDDKNFKDIDIIYIVPILFNILHRCVCLVACNDVMNLRLICFGLLSSSYMYNDLSEKRENDRTMLIFTHC